MSECRHQVDRVTSNDLKGQDAAGSQALVTAIAKS